MDRWLKPAGGVILDTSDLDFVQVVDELEKIVREKGGRAIALFNGPRRGPPQLPEYTANLYDAAA